MSTALVVLAFLVVFVWPTGAKRASTHAALAFALFVLVGGALVLERGWP